jgi:serine/threonine protein kinase
MNLGGRRVLMSKSSDKESAFGLSGEQIERLLSIGYGKSPDVVEPLSSSGTSDRKLIPNEVEGSESTPQIDGYEIIEKVAEAGQGQVWRALQHSTGRVVAIKVPRLGKVTSERARVRFEREIELAARLKHPNIARIYDSGVDRGQYYYVMDFVEGLNLDEYVRQHCLSNRQILELMRTICQAVQHAHQNGIIHRDLKPSNIIVTENGRPFIVDFGLAKGFSEDDRNLVVSVDGETFGTPAYMSPEQAAGHTDKVDTRTDVYSLGVTLFTLLTGSNPHDLSGTRLEVMHRIAEKEVIRPSALNRKIDTDIEALLLKALERDPDRRYSSAAGLAEDIDNYLKGEPLIAGPPTSLYRLKKFVRRHKSLVASLIAVFVVLAAGVITTSIFALKARRQAQRSDAIVDFLTNDVLGSADQVMGRDATAIDLLDAAIVRLDEGVFKDQPHTELLIRYRLGNLIKELGYSKKAIPYLERVQEIYEKYGAPKPLSSHLIMNYLGLAYLCSGELEKAETLFQQIIKEKEETNHIYTDLYPWVKRRAAGIYRMKAQYAESERILLEMMDPQFRNGKGLPSNPNYMATCMCELAETYRGQGRYKEAEQMYIKIKEMGEQVPSRFLVRLYLSMGRYAQAEELLRAEIERIPRELPGKDHVSLIAAKNDLAMLLTKQERYEEAEKYFLEAVEGRRLKLGEKHPHTIESTNNLIDLYEAWNKLEEAKKWQAKLKKIEVTTE